MKYHIVEADSKSIGDCVERTITKCFNMDYNSVCSQIHNLSSTFEFLANHGFRCLKNKKYDVDAWLETYFYETEESELDMPFEEWLDMHDVAYMDLHTMLEQSDGIEEHSFIIDGFDIPKDCFGYPALYREHFMYYGYGTLFDDDWGSYDCGSFFVKRIHIHQSGTNSFKQIVTDICDTINDVSYNDMEHEIWDSFNNNNFLVRGAL